MIDGVMRETRFGFAVRMFNREVLVEWNDESGMRVWGVDRDEARSILTTLVRAHAQLPKEEVTADLSEDHPTEVPQESTRETIAENVAAEEPDPTAEEEREAIQDALLLVSLGDVPENLKTGPSVANLLTFLRSKGASVDDALEFCHHHRSEFVCLKNVKDVSTRVRSLWG